MKFFILYSSHVTRKNFFNSFPNNEKKYNSNIKNDRKNLKNLVRKVANIEDKLEFVLNFLSNLVRKKF